MKTGITVSADSMPDITVNKGLDSARHWYLYHEIRALSHSPLAKEVRPRPSVTKHCNVKEEYKKKK